MNLLFDPDKGLGINIVRYNVGGGDCEALDFINRSGAKIPGYLGKDGHYRKYLLQNQMRPDGVPAAKPG